jgi:hypothetical protein
LSDSSAAKAAIRGQSSNSRRRPSAVAHSWQLPSWLKIIAAILEQPVIEKILNAPGTAGPCAAALT